MYAKVREHGAPVQGARLVSKPESGGRMTANTPNRALQGIEFFRNLLGQKMRAARTTWAPA